MGITQALAFQLLWLLLNSSVPKVASIARSLLTGFSRFFNQEIKKRSSSVGEQTFPDRQTNQFSRMNQVKFSYQLLSTNSKRTTLIIEGLLSSFVLFFLPLNVVATAITISDFHGKVFFSRPRNSQSHLKLAISLSCAQRSECNMECFS